MTLPTGDCADAAQRYFNVKTHKYRNYLDELRAQGIVYKPIIWTAWGRAHPDAVSVLRSLATKAARRRGLISATDVLAKSRLHISLELQARAARMVMACLPKSEEQDDDAD